MFLGEYQHSLDAKGRIILPSKFRGLLADGCVLTRGLDKCLAVYPPQEWESVSARLRESSQSNRQVRDFLRIWYASAVEEEPDKQGRITVPEHLREYAGLEREVTVTGRGEFAEIWSRTAWAQRLSEGLPNYADLSESNPDLPF
ncbi:MAG: division/cell wall cluster transcriptional repressor MraZ [Actinobacteria bacterium]|nr:MAG: division/cell wall cluster transcriptional repressor MraZ [Actinomycetota bacterium]TMK83855.1 MAG: division/cell wall cluster transcriptional repressor MraZ [Actinomycetota bacterium]TML82008.1 MAG: division/cell wall cluster transcriptional repressor MraZ [Actinomycetota bacterium]